MQKNILLIGINSELALNTLKELNSAEFNIYATTRRAGLINEKIHEFYLDVEKESDFINLKEKIKDLKFETIINFTGIAIAGAVENLEEKQLKKQLDVNLFGLLRIIKYICPQLEEKGKFINVSSMAQYGIFPFLSPYSISKSAGDILLNNYAIENNIKVVSIRPGAIATKFWESSIENNKETFEKETKNTQTYTFNSGDNQKDENKNLNQNKYEKEINFLIKNAQKNALHAKSPIYAGKKIARIIETKNPKAVYNIGFDAKIAKLSRFLPQNFVNNLIKTVLKQRIKKEISK